MRSHRLIDYSW